MFPFVLLSVVEDLVWRMIFISKYLYINYPRCLHMASKDVCMQQLQNLYIFSVLPINKTTNL